MAVAATTSMNRLTIVEGVCGRPFGQGRTVARVTTASVNRTKNDGTSTCLVSIEEQTR
jgi:hypothetical protein